MFDTLGIAFHNLVMSNIAIIVGSQRINSQSHRVAKYIQGVLENQLATSTYLLDLGTNPLPFFDPGLTIEEKTDWLTVAPKIESATGYILITPEWNGMATPAIKNFLLFVKSSMADKPAMIVSVSSARGGAYPIQEMRMSSYKNTGVCYTPEHIIVRNVESVLQAEFDANNKEDEYIRNRIEYASRVLLEYSKALELVRSSGVIDRVAYPNGM